MSSSDSAVVREVEAFLEPVSRAAESSYHRRQLLLDMGWNPDEVPMDQLPSALNDVLSATQNLVDVADEPPETLAEFDDLLSTLGDLFDGITDLQDAVSSISGIDQDTVEQFGADLVSALTISYLSRDHPVVINVGLLLTVVTEADAAEPITDADGNVVRMNNPTPYADFERVGDLLTTPTETLSEAYLATGDQFDLDDARRNFADLLDQIAFFASLASFDVVSGTSPIDQDSDLVSGDQVGWIEASLAESVAGLSMRVYLILYADGDGNLTVLVTPEGDGELTENVGRWSIEGSLSVDASAVAISSDDVTFESADDTEIMGSATATRLPAEGSDNSFVLGGTDSTRLEFGEYSLSNETTVHDSGTDLDFLAMASDSSIVVDPEDGDSFIQKVFPADGVGVDFDAGLGWATERGVYFKGGGAGLETEIPVNLSIADVLTVNTLQLGAQPGSEDGTFTVPVHVAVDPQVTLGPIDATVRGIGLQANIAVPEGGAGNLGPLAVALEFKPPTGAGMSVDAGVVTGGGYLEFDHENERYTGVLQLQIGELTLTAIGLLTTQLPGGRDGFSLLLIISGEFPAFQLGFGFTLEGVGGLLGTNRTMDVDYLVAGVSDGTVRSIMFPDDPVRNAPQIISDLRNGFPVAAGTHVFGPMGKLGWGTPTMLSASIGVIMALPDPIRIAILGRVHVGLPHEEAGIVVLNMDVIGAVDFGEQTAQAAASLYNSRILAYTLTGDMAMKTGWGDDPNFALSVGGFNPRFDPPPEFPELRRIALTLGPGNPRVRWEGYFAVTSNTVQVGASVEVYAAAAGFSFEGKMGFDTLFRFDPFKLIADFYAGFALKRGGSQLMSVNVDGTLKGPGPWHVTGEASFEIWPVSFNVSIDKKFGEAASADELSPADVFGKVVAALGDDRNWSAQRPANGVSAVTLRQVEADNGQVLAHPLGQLAVRQKISPLGVQVETYGNGSPATYDRFEIAKIEWGNLADEDGEQWSETNPDETREQFARGEYFDLTDDEKLEGPPFESYEAGCELAAPGFDFGGNEDESQMTSGTLAYETAVIDEKASHDPVAVGQIGMPRSTAESLAEVSAVARGPLRTMGNARYRVTDEDTAPTGVESSVAVSDVRFVVARTDDMSRVSLEAIPDEGTTWQEATEALEAYLEDADGDREDYQIVGIHEVADGEDDQ